MQDMFIDCHILSEETTVRPAEALRPYFTFVTVTRNNNIFAYGLHHAKDWFQIEKIISGYEQMRRLKLERTT